MSKTKITILVCFLLATGILLYLGPEKYLNLDFIKSQLSQLLNYRAEHPLLTAFTFSLVYITATAASIPGALVLTLAAGAIFGFVQGTIIAVTSATIGATISFLIARYLFDDLVQKKMGDKIASIRENFKKEGALYLFSMRLVPAFPFVVVNLIMGLTSIRTRTYMIASFIGMLPGTMVFINAGTQLAKLDSLSGLLSPSILVSFLILAIFPYVAKYLLSIIRNRKS